MKLWRLQYTHDDCGSGRRQAWFSSKADALAHHKTEAEIPADDDPWFDLECVDSGSGKGDLLRFLNRHAQIC